MRFFKQNVWALTLAICGVTALSTPAVAAEDLGNGWGPSPLEIAQLPPYCHEQFINKDTGAIYKHFSGCSGIHHMCPGLVLINRSANPAIPRPERQRILRQSKNEIAYVSTRLTPNCTAAPAIQAAEARIRVMETLLK